MPENISDFDTATIYAEAAKRLGIPYGTLDHFYLPIVSPPDIKNRGIDAIPVIDPARFFNMKTIKKFASAIASSYDDKLPSYPEILKTELGLGYGTIEVAIYTAVIRAYKPSLIVEIGAGISTWCARRATKGTNCRIVCVEPYPNQKFVQWCKDEGVELLQAPLQQVRDALPMSKNMILFIDSTHVARIDSELHSIFIDVLPRVPAGSLIHFHDIFLPFPTIHSDHNMFSGWANYYESVLLGIFLSASSSYEVVFPQYWLQQGAPEILEETLPIYRKTRAEGSSFWMRKRKDPAPSKKS